MSEESAQLLANMQAQAQEKYPYVFILPARLQRIRERQKQGKWNARLQIVNNMRKTFRAMCDKAGVTKLTLHDLRRSAITNWAQRLPIQIVQQLAGHSDISTTKKYYLAVRSEDLESAGKLFNSIMSEYSNDRHQQVF
jgi:integrase